LCTTAITSGRAVDFAVDEARQVGARCLRRDCLAGGDLVLDDVGRRYLRRRQVAREQEARGVAVIAHAHVAEGVRDALVEQDVIGVHQLLDQLRAGVDTGHALTPAGCCAA
jgi:hypothetical protein